MVELEKLNKCTERIRGKTTLVIWAKSHGINVGTLKHFLGGRCGKRQIGVSADIIAALKQDGILDAE